MNFKSLKLFVTIVLLNGAMLAHGVESTTEPDSVAGRTFERADDFKPYNGEAPQFSLDAREIPGGKNGLKLVYKNGKSGWGNLATPITFADYVESISLQVRKDSADAKAAMHIWLFQPSGDAWLSKPILLSDLKDGWNRVRIPVSEFTFQPRGTKTRDIASADTMLIGCNFGDFTATIADVRFEGKDIQKKWAAMMNSQAIVTVGREKPIVENFLGFGAEWDPKFWTMGTFKIDADFTGDVKVTEADWDLVIKRIKWMRLPIVRMMICCRWCTAGDGKFDWDNKHMQSLYRHLDVCQKEGIQVILTDWGCITWTKVPGFSGTGDTKYADAIGTYLDHLINGKKYSCIKYFVLVNEPNFEAGGYDQWKQGVQNVAKVIGERKLNEKIMMLGPDESGADDWHHRAVDQLADCLGGYDIHRYAGVDEVRSGGAFQHFQSMWNYALERDAHAKSKPFIVAEAGINGPGFGAATNGLHLNYEYGLYMADYAAQAANAGSWAALAWMLDDSSHAGFTWGMWKNKDGNFALKPWFYPWSLLVRNFPRGCRILPVKNSLRDVRVLAAEIPGKEAPSWSFCFVNRGKEARTVTLAVPGASKTTLNRFVYTRQSAKADVDGFPQSDESTEADFENGFAITVPAEGVMFLTSSK